MRAKRGSFGTLPCWTGVRPDLVFTPLLMSGPPGAHAVRPYGDNGYCGCLTCVVSLHPIHPRGMDEDGGDTLGPAESGDLAD